jgi:hypothetical protein
MIRAAIPDAVEARAPFLITPRELVDVTAAFEAVVTSLATSMPVKVPCGDAAGRCSRT